MDLLRVGRSVPKRRQEVILGKILLFIFAAALGDSAFGHSASKVSFEFRPNGKFRVYVTYTIPALKEAREVYVDFLNQKKAEQFYWKVVRGGDFHLPDPHTVHFHPVPRGPDPW